VKLQKPGRCIVIVFSNVIRKARWCSSRRWLALYELGEAGDWRDLVREYFVRVPDNEKGRQESGTQAQGLRLRDSGSMDIQGTES
jgi:hypothetical protein